MSKARDIADGAANINLLDDVTAGTVAASKVIAADSNKDVASFRNVTLTGELDAATLDVSGNADIDGVLETDGLSINGTSVTATAAELNVLDGLARGALIYGNASAATAALSAGGSGTVLTSDGTDIAWQAAAGGGGLKSVQVFTSSGTWTKPSGIAFIKVTVTGGGGGGGGTQSGGNNSAGGGAGGTAIRYLDVSSISSVTVTIGAGGIGGYNSAHGGDGGQTTFGTYATGNGGSGGKGSSTSTPQGGAGGSGSAAGDKIAFTGGTGHGTSYYNTDYRYAPSGHGGASFWGGGGRGGRGGAEDNGQQGPAYGTGGGGSKSNTSATTGGNGYQGVVLVEEYE